MSKHANPHYTPLPRSVVGYDSFKSFYPYYLGEHHEPRNRTLHIIGTTGSVLLQLRALVGIVPAFVATYVPALADSVGWWRKWNLSAKDAGRYLLGSLLCGYAFAWVGHFFLEKNKPATFKHPLYSLRGDYTMWWHVITGQRVMYPDGFILQQEHKAV